MQLTQLQQTALQDIEESKSVEYLNYLEWLPLQQYINQSVDQWISQIYTGANKKVYDLLFEYCSWVELLITLDGDHEAGNIQYFVQNANNINSQVPLLTSAQEANIAKAALQQIENPVNNDNIIYITPGIHNTQVNTPGVTQPATPTTVLSQQSYLPPQTGVNSTSQSQAASNPTGNTGTDAVTLSKYSNWQMKNQGAGGITNSISPQDPTTRSQYLSGYIGKPIMLKYFSEDTSGGNAADLMRGLTNGASLTASQVINPADASDSLRNGLLPEMAQAQTQNNLFLQTWDGSKLHRFFNNTLGQLASLCINVYTEIGIQSPYAILAWGMISQILNQINDATSNNDPLLLFVIKYTGATLQNTTGPIYSTDLQAHKALRQFIMTNLINMDGGIQSFINEFGQSPITKRFRQYHIATSYEHIVDNNIVLDYSSMWNAVKVKYQRHDVMNLYIPGVQHILGMFGGQYGNEFNIQAGQTLYDRITKENSLIVENAKTRPQAMNYATSILAEGIRHMYSGTLTLLGNPEIKPWDCVMIYDDNNRMYGPITVRNVTHIMSAEQGFVTIIEPDAYVEPLSIDLGASAFIADIFDVGLAVLTFVPGLGEVGLAGKAAEGTSFFAGREIADLTTKKFWTDVIAAASKQGSNAYAAMKTFLASSKDKLLQGYAATYEGEVNAAWQEQVGGFLTKVGAANDKNIAQAVDNFTSQVISQINKTNVNVAPIENISQAPMEQIIPAMKQVLQQTNANSALAEQIDEFIASISLKPIASRITGFSGAVANLFKAGFNIQSISKTLGINILNATLILAGLGYVSYYQMFAGLDDPNYACPLRITPLTYRGEPYTVGLDGITHQSGILNYINNSWRRFEGSLKTTSQAFEYEANKLFEIFKY